MIDVDRDGLEAAIARVQASFEAARVSSYGFSAGAGNILIQRMVDAEYSGVLFTRDPSAGGLAMIEMVQGTAENLVSGTVRPQHLPLRPRHQEAVRQGRRADRSRSAAGDGRRRRASVRRSAGHGMGLSRWPLPSGAEPRHHPAGGRRRGHGRDAERPRACHRHRQGRVARSGGVRQERAVGNAAAADPAVAVAHGSRCGLPAAASISPRASSASPTASRTARTIS